MHRENLLDYAETMLGLRNRENIAPFPALAQHLAECEACSSEVEAIRRHLADLHRLPPLQPPDDLAARCLQAARATTPQRAHPWLRRSMAVGFAVLLLAAFATGMWMGQSRDEQSKLQQTFVALSGEQEQLFQEFENLLEARYGSTALEEDQPWSAPYQRFKATGEIILGAYQENQADPVIVRGLTIAVSQNIAILKALCEYMGKEEVIPDFDYKLFETPGSPVAKQSI